MLVDACNIFRARMPNDKPSFQPHIISGRGRGCHDLPPPHLSLPLFGELLPHSRSPKKKNIYNGNVTTSYLTGVTQKLPKKAAVTSYKKITGLCNVTVTALHVTGYPKALQMGSNKNWKELLWLFRRRRHTTEQQQKQQK